MKNVTVEEKAVFANENYALYDNIILLVDSYTDLNTIVERIR